MVSYNFCDAEKNNWSFIDQISGSRRSMLLFLLPEKDPRAAKTSGRAALWPCLLYAIYLANGTSSSSSTYCLSKGLIDIPISKF